MQVDVCVCSAATHTNTTEKVIENVVVANNGGKGDRNDDDVDEEDSQAGRHQSTKNEEASLKIYYNFQTNPAQSAEHCDYCDFEAPTDKTHRLTLGCMTDIVSD